jgi:outer membrane protein assembly factor BamB
MKPHFNNCCLFLLAMVLLPIQLPAQAADSWPVFRGNAQADGVAMGYLPDQLQVIWKKPFKDALFESTAAIVDGVVYVGGLDGYFRALDLKNGDEKWKFHSELGFKAPAAVRDGLAYIGDSDGIFYCLDAATGQEKWKLQTDAEINAGANFYDSAVLIGSQDGSLHALDARTGKSQWKYTIENMIQCSPTIIDNRVFIAGCDGKLHVLELKPGTPTSIVDKQIIDIQDPTGTTPAAVGDRVYFGTQGSRFFCFDWRQLEKVWSFEPRRKQPFQASAAVRDGVVVVGGRDRAVHGLDADKGNELWQFPTRSRIDASPVIVGTRVMIASGDGRLYALDLKTGVKYWEYEAGGGFTASPAVAEGRMVIGNDDGELYCFGEK